tara:strand:+ start:306 stop:437 length:132 start_codon:yes stop_codon:yes gene_type:complete
MKKFKTYINEKVLEDFEEDNVKPEEVDKETEKKENNEEKNENI